MNKITEISEIKFAIFAYNCFYILRYYLPVTTTTKELIIIVIMLKVSYLPKGTYLNIYYIQYTYIPTYLYKYGYYIYLSLYI